MKFDHENPNDRIFSNVVSLTIKLDIPVAFSAHHPSSSLLYVKERPFKYTLFCKRMSAFKGLANKDLHVLWNYVR